MGQRDRSRNEASPDGWMSLLRLLACIIGGIVLLGCIPAVYTIYTSVLYPALSHPRLIGPTGSAIAIIPLQYLGYCLMALLLFRYFARLRPLEISPSGKSFNVRPFDSSEFWVPIVVILMIANLVHLREGRLSLPTLSFDVVLLLLLQRRYSPQALSILASDAPIALFLRPFASFSDRAILTSILNSLPRELQAVFFVPRHESFLSRDPYSLGLAGLRLWQPCASAPIALVASEDEWETCVKYLIVRSRLIFIDISRITPALASEIEFIHQLAAQDRTIVCIDVSVPYDLSRADLLSRGRWRGIVEFRKKLRIGQSLVALGLTLFAVFGVSLMLTSALALPEWAKALSAGVLVLCALRYWFVVFAKRGVGRDFSNRLRRLVGTSGRRGRYGKLLTAGLVGIVIVHLARAALSWHVVAGDQFDVAAEVTLVGEKDRESLPHEFVTDLRALKTAAEWQLLPGDLHVDAVDIKQSEVAWYDGDNLVVTDGVKFYLQGKGRTSEGESAELWFSLHGLRNSHPGVAAPRLLYGLKPFAPRVIGDAYVWLVDGWDIHESRWRAARASALHFTRILLLLAVPVASIVAGWRVMKY
jgi:hypothetical protein